MSKKIQCAFVMSVLFCMLLISRSALAVTIRADVDPNQYVLFGQDPTFDPVGMLYYKQNGLWNRGGSATLIADPSGSARYLLTAAHAVDVGTVTEMRFFLGDSILQNYEMAEVKSWVIHPEYPGSPGGTGVDLALVELMNPVLDVPPARILPADLVDDVVTVGTKFTFSGFGPVAIAGTSQSPFDGEKRAAENAITSIGSELLGVEPQYWLAYFDHPDQPSILPLEGGGNPGDSGGGAFYDYNGMDYYIGMPTFVSGDYRYYGSDTGFLNVGLYQDWAYANMSTVPEPGTLILLASGSLAVLPALRRRKRKKVA